MNTPTRNPFHARALGLALGVVLTAGCAAHRPAPVSTAPPPPPVEAYDAQAAARSAAYQENSTFVAGGELTSMFQDTKARRAGDIVTVKIEESSKASNTANTKTARDSSMTAGIDALMGIDTWWQDKLLRWLKKLG